MNNKLLLITLLCFQIGQQVWAQPTTEIGRKSLNIKELVDQFHCIVISFDDVFSKKVFESFIISIDPDGMYFLEADITSLQHSFYIA